MDIEFDYKGDPIGGVISNCECHVSRMRRVNCMMTRLRFLEQCATVCHRLKLILADLECVMFLLCQLLDFARARN